MIEITLFNLSGLYMGPVAQIASMLVYPSNDNFATSKLLEKALKEVEKTPLDDKDYSFPNADVKGLGMMEDASEWLYKNSTGTSDKKETSHIQIVPTSSKDDK